jgi:hypothetical protein
MSATGPREPESEGAPPGPTARSDATTEADAGLAGGAGAESGEASVNPTPGMIEGEPEEDDDRD